jgi:hypothetical protein
MPGLRPVASTVTESLVVAAVETAEEGVVAGEIRALISLATGAAPSF